MEKIREIQFFDRIVERFQQEQKTPEHRVKNFY